MNPNESFHGLVVGTLGQEVPFHVLSHSIVVIVLDRELVIVGNGKRAEPVIPGYYSGVVTTDGGLLR